MREATNAHYAERYLNLVGLLTNAPRLGRSSPR